MGHIIAEQPDMLKDSVYNAIRTRIITQDLPPGSRINEKQFMDEYGIGKTPLREVFFRLQYDGLIRRFPRSGTIVAPLDFGELRDAAEIRLALEGLVGDLAAKLITVEQLEAMRRHTDLLERTSREGVHAEYVITEAQLHGMLYAATRNEKLRQTITEQQSLFSRIWFSIERTPGDLEPQVADWRNICAALAERDARRVVQINKQHFKTFYNHLKAIF